MNERIKQLERQCWQSTDSDPYAFFDVKKFAELIVVECAHLVDTLNEAYGAPSTAGKFIKEHFGVD